MEDMIFHPARAIRMKGNDGFSVPTGDARNRLVDTWFNAYQKANDVDNYMRVEEFEKYAQLFSTELREKILNYELDETEKEDLAALSKEFTDKINVFKPLHIVDANGNEVLPTIPPMHRSMASLHGKGGEAINIFHNAHDVTDFSPVHQIQQKKATFHLCRMLQQSQDASEVVEQVKQFDKMTAEFANLNKPQQVQEQVQQQVQATQQEDDSRPPDMDLFGD